MRLNNTFAALAVTLAATLALAACEEPEVETTRALATVAADRGEISRVVGATGKIVPRNEVMVGSEVSGKVMEVLVDFNTPVAKGDVLATIDPTSFQSRVRQIQSRIDSARADLDVQRASVERARVTLDNAERQLARRSGLFDQDAISEAQLESAQRDVGVARADRTLAEARIASAEASIRSLQAQLTEARADLDRTTIVSPIDGIVIDRKIDPGQTVQASFSAPELFALAADLSEIQVEATIVESDVAGLEAGDTARFTVDAYPDMRVDGTVEQLRLKSATNNNIVSYTAVIAAPNPDGRLMPGMTANLQIVTEKKDGVRRLPVSAERFRPAPDDLASFERTPEADGDADDPLLAPTYARLRAIGLPEARIDAFAARILPITEKTRETINDPTRSFMHTPMRIQLAETIDNTLKSFLDADARQAYAAQISLERTVRPVEVWVASGDGMVRRTVKLGLSDGTFVEVVDGLGEDDQVVTAIRDQSPDGAGRGRPPGVGG